MPPVGGKHEAAGIHFTARRRGGVSVCGARTAGEAPRVGVLTFGNPEPSVSLLRERLRDLGYVDGQTMQFLPRNAEGSSARLAELAAELVRLKVDIIIGVQTPAVQAAKKATSDIPIVMASAGDPVGTGLVESLARPGGNVTGLSGTTSELGAKISSSFVRLRPR